MHLIGNSEVRKNPSAVGNPTSSGFSSAQFGLLWMSSWTFQGYFIVWYQCRWQCRKHCCKSWIFIFICNCLRWQSFLGTVFSEYNEVEAITVYRMTYNIYKQYTSIHDICGFCFVIEWEINKVACNTLYVTWSALMWFKTEFPLPGSIWQMLSAPMHNEFDCMLSGSNQGVSVSFEHNVHNTVHVICICFIWTHTLCIFLGRGPWFTACPLIIMHQCRANLNSNTAT